MRALRYLIPRDVKDSLDSNAGFQCFVAIFAVVVAVLFVRKGINGFKNKRITGKNGREFEGPTAELISVIWIAVGALLALAGIGTIISKFVAALS